MTQTLKIAVVAGDGIGPEVMAEALKVLNACLAGTDLRLDQRDALVGGAAIDATGKALPEETLEACESAGAILFGSIGGPKWENLPAKEQPERAALLPLRQHFKLFANLRPAICYPELAESSPLRPDLVTGGFDILCVRELTGGLYFGQPKETRLEGKETVAIDTMVYRSSEIERIVRLGFEIARTRQRKLVSVDKANVLENSLLWRAAVRRLAESYRDVSVTHLLVDNAAMQFIRNPREFNLVVTENLFGDILSDELAMLTGSIGMLPSASLGVEQESGLSRFGLYEPSGGSAPDIAGQGIANPIAQILSAALMLRYSFGLNELADRIEQAVRQTIASGLRTRDIAKHGERALSTSEMGDAICRGL